MRSFAFRGIAPKVSAVSDSGARIPDPRSGTGNQKTGSRRCYCFAKAPPHLTTVSFTLLFSVPEGVETVTYPVVVPVGIVAVR